MSSQKIELPGDAASCQEARRFVGECLRQATDDLRAIALLLVSEVATNALLHVRGPITVEVRQEEEAYRITVGDKSRKPLTDRGYRLDDATGRGMHLLNSLAAAWGCTQTSTGKAVWFDLPVPLDDSVIPGTERPANDDPYPNGTLIELIGAPVQEMIRAGAHYDALYREFRLILGLDSSHLDAIPGRLLTLIDKLGDSYLGVGRQAGEAWDRAVREKRDTVDLHFRLPPEAGPVLARYDQLLDEADEFCRNAQVLTVAPTDEAVYVRRWAFAQVVCQCLGEPPTPWLQMPS